MDPVEELYNMVVDGNTAIAKRKEAMSKLENFYLTDDLRKLLSKIATNTTMPFEIRQRASDRLAKNK